MSYKVTFLNDEEFERLPGKDMEGKVGVAYPNLGEAYVRKSGSNLVDVFSAMHELEHLEGSDRGEIYDADNQCYYKNFADTLPAIGTAIGTFFGGPVGGTLGGAAGSLGQNQFGQGPGSKSYAKSQMGQQNVPQMEALQAPEEPSQPFTSQAQGGMSVGAGKAGGNAIKSLSSQPQFNDINNQRYGNISGRSPLMDAFGGQ